MKKLVLNEKITEQCTLDLEIEYAMDGLSRERRRLRNIRRVQGDRTYEAERKVTEC